MKSFGNTFWGIVLFGVAVLCIEGIFFNDLKNSIGPEFSLILFVATVLLVVFVSLFVSWKEGQTEILTTYVG